MSRKQLGGLLLFLGLVVFLGSIVGGVTAMVGMFRGFAPVATFESPGFVEFQAGEADIHTLWHDHETNFEGRAIGNPLNLPADFTFTLTDSGSGDTIPFQALGSSSTMTLSIGSREASGLGTFELPHPGSYRLEATNPAGDARVFSLSPGSFGSNFGAPFARLFLFGALAVLGIVLLIVGIVLLIVGSKPKQSTPPSLATS